MKRSLPLYISLFVIFIAAFSVQNVYSQQLLVENFDYPSGTLLINAGWTAHSGSGTESVDVTTPGLSFTGYPLSDIGGAALLDNTGEDVNKTFVSQTSGTVYVAFMVKVDGAAEGYFLHLGGDPIGTTFRGKTFIIGTSSPFNFGLSVGSNTATPVDGGSYTYGTTYLCVLKYEIVDGSANNVVSLFVISGEVPTSEPATPSIGPLTDASQSDINPASIALRQFSASQNITIDGIRIGTSWSEAVTDALSSDETAPVFTTDYPAVNNIDATQADLEVNMDEAGTAYYVVVPDGSDAPAVSEVIAGADYGTVTLVAHGSIDVLAGSTTYSATITDLTDETNYDIYVVAEDDEATPNCQSTVTLVNLYTEEPASEILSVDFASSLDPFTQVSITGDQTWYYSSGYAKVSGYVSSTSTNYENLDYLISPVINLSASEDNKLSFRTMKNYDGIDLKVVISTDFSGTYTATDVAAATWTDISSNFSFSTGSWESVNSGEFSLADYTGNVYIAFVYESTTEGAATWEVDDILITGYLLQGSDATLSDLKVDGTTIDSFDPATISYEYVLEASVTTVPAVTYTTTDDAASAVVNNATDLAGDATARTTTVVVTAADGTTTQTYSILFNPIIAVADMAALRAVSSENYDRVYQVTGEVIVSGLNDGNRHQKYVQDATAGITIDDYSGTITTTYSVGDGITNLTGTLTSYQNLLELVPYSDPGTASSTGNILTPQEVTVSEFTTNQESYESELVKILGVTFADATGSATFAEKTNYDITVGSDATVVRTAFLGTDLTGAVIPYMADVTGIAIVYNTTAQLTPRNYEDLDVYSSDATLSDLKVDGTMVTGFASGTLTYNVSLAAGTTTVPTVTATATDSDASVEITAATSLTGDATARTTTIDVTSHDKSSVKNYSIVFTVATGIEDDMENEISVYPNPSSVEIKITGTDNVSLIEIFDVAGVKVITRNCDDEIETRIPVSDLANGVYFVKLTTSKETIIKKFIKN